jgi:hypothetical protein
MFLEEKEIIAIYMWETIVSIYFIEDTSIGVLGVG